MEDFERKWLPTYIKHGLVILFCGINPGRISASKGYHYANPANLFWRGLHEGGLTPYQLKPEETDLLLKFGYGITDLVARPTRSSSDLSKADFINGAKDFERLVQTYRPKLVCFNGVTAFRYAVNQLKETVTPGLQPGYYFGTESWEGCFVFVIPSTSGANAHFTREERIGLFNTLAEFIKEKGWLLP
ncbi:mismatch-specific DNA-glycosylase [Bacillus sp. 165]|uniref:mismatch-specific DNA-glycosylase n=1 Tax=Bacillus sp. 165 TaxID=1529117 RepID=UPI001ADD52E3|nr:mismatch-specific DNA-glycosylase [Bacillus sp. 165]MBO9129219.1 mismatch-specific DNA-glycosylase [Bacillus sp. 165]